MKRLQLNLSLTSVIIFIAVGVLLPVLLSTAAGIVAIVFARNAGGIVTGVLVISFTVTAAGCGIVAVVLAGRKARLARRQADFVANVSHELRTPLSAIKLYAQTLQSGRLADDPEKAADCLAVILRETEWLDAMVEKVLTWRASSKDALPLAMEVKPISGAVDDAIQRFRSMVAPGEIEFSHSVETRLPVRHDPRALNAVVLNLLTNAYKYTGDRKEIALRVHDGEGQAVIEVQDNGVGLSALEAKRAFDAFYRVEKPDGKTPGGVGLGLAIARHLVRHQGGTISVDSEKGKGTTFVIRLPGADAESKT